MAGRPKLKMPRLMRFTVPQDLHDLIAVKLRMLTVAGVPMSSVAVELLSEMQPALQIWLLCQFLRSSEAN